ncbi:partitioning defective 6 homolog gamma-like [Clavelina lepadiformis]|uniref:partitioning defective 6 homolog gamma-like n=1 Tax=Clavelina lepadiformis TaxID=159417 RepID=UPI0040423F5A
MIMSANARDASPFHNKLLQVKSKYLAEFRRFPVDVTRDSFEDFSHKLESIHHLTNFEFVITYTDPVHGDLLPINNEENFTKAKQSCMNSIMRVYVHRKDNLNLMNGFGQSTVRRRKGKKNVPKISFPEDFRPVSAIIDVDILPETLRRVRLHNHGIHKPLGFFIRDGVSLRMSDNGLEKVPGIFISRLVQGGLAEMTGLLAVNDEVLEVNGIEVSGKSLDQVTDMMVANSSNLIITVKPASMRNNVGSTRLQAGERFSAAPHPRHHHGYESDEDDDGDVVKDLSSTSSKAYSSDRSARSGDGAQQRKKFSPSSSPSRSSPKLNRPSDGRSKSHASPSYSSPGRRHDGAV